MRFTLLAYGSRGDVQPYVALGAGLRRAGHEVCLAAPAMFEPFVAGYGLEFAPLAGDPAQLVQQAVERAGPGATLLGLARVVLEHALPIAAEVMRGCMSACQGSDAIIHSLLLTTAGYEIARLLDVPDFSALIFPAFAPTGAFPNQGMPALPLGPVYNRLTHRFFSALYWHGGRLGYSWVRRKHPELPRLTTWPFDPKNERVTPILYGFSPKIIPRPPDWGAHVHVTGYWFLDAAPGWRPPPALVEFLASGPPPVFVGFGSTISRDVGDLAAIALAALADTGQRGLLLSGWGGLAPADLPDNVFPIEDAPFAWLFPRMKAVVHHGGVGTTADALRAGVPSIIVPFTADQPYWGRRIQQLGVGPAPIDHRQLTAGRLAEAIRIATTDEALRRRAADLGARLRAEDGVTRALEIVDRAVSTPAGSPRKFETLHVPQSYKRRKR
jgi:sterol 3beta-glucosyltransferase